MCSHFCYKMLHCGMWDWCIVEFVQQVRWHVVPSSLVQLMACRLYGVKPLPEPRYRISRWAYTPFCCVLFCYWYVTYCLPICAIYLPIFFRVTSVCYFNLGTLISNAHHIITRCDFHVKTEFSSCISMAIFLEIFTEIPLCVAGFLPSIRHN